MKRIISFLVAAVIFAASISVFSAAEKKETSAYEYGRLLDTAEFTASYFWGYEGFQPSMTIYCEAEDLFPDHLQYKKSEWGDTPYYLLTEEELWEVCRSCYPNAPVNLFETDIKQEVLNIMTAFGFEKTEGTYVVPFPGGAGGFLIEPEYVGYFEKADGTYEFYFAKREVFYLPPEAYPEEYTDKVEYGGRVYECQFGEYIALGDLMSTGYKIALESNGTGIYLLSAEQDFDIPTGMSVPPAPDGDVNGDGKVNARDVTAIMKSLVGIGGERIPGWSADINRDDKVNAKDVVALMKMLITD